MAGRPQTLSGVALPIRATISLAATLESPTAAAAGHGLSGAQWWLLSEPAEPGGDGSALIELARARGLAAATAASEAPAPSGGLIRRDRDPANRRLVRAWITPAGRDLSTAIWQQGRTQIPSLAYGPL
ncbi:hypothetical protein ACQP1P_04390 [Dactylosporangium sp. CA-052675]|uniref:hypothetical protein n=1 Tax=Dactylosporangium sp. CA-052675 TaxID=3239927 RepID=UPI003D8C5BFB